MMFAKLQLLQARKINDSAERLNAGFTLIELMISLLIASIVLAAVYGVYATQTRSYTTQNVSAEVQQAIRAAMEYMAEDIMMAGLDPEKKGAGFSQATDKRVDFTMDTDMDGILENISYVWSGTDGDPLFYNGNIFVDSVKELKFEYLNLAGNTILNPGANLPGIRTVVFSITVEEPAGRIGMVERTYSTRVRCRNMGLN